jgi:hypothetical protein
MELTLMKENKAKKNLLDLHDAREALMLAEQALTRAMAGIGQSKGVSEFVFQVDRAQAMLSRITERIGR